MTEQKTGIKKPRFPEAFAQLAQKGKRINVWRIVDAYVLYASQAFYAQLHAHHG